jgi:hypothetical protein
MSGPVRVELEIHTADPISGTIRSKDGHPVAFTGWLRLVALLEEAIAGLPGAERGIRDG